VLREHPFLSAFMPGHLKSHLRLLRVADAAFGDRTPVRLGQGNAEVAELVSALLARGFDGLFAVAAADLAATVQALSDFTRLVAEVGLPDLPVGGRHARANLDSQLHIEVPA
jgi:hypothetical protein